MRWLGVAVWVLTTSACAAEGNDEQTSRLRERIERLEASQQKLNDKLLGCVEEKGMLRADIARLETTLSATSAAPAPASATAPAPVDRPPARRPKSGTSSPGF